MNIFDQLGKIYTEIDSGYASKELIATFKGHHKKEAEYAAKRRYNDQAYFLYMFTRLEGRIRELSDNLIDDKIAKLSNWKFRRAWEIMDKKNLHFMKRVALLSRKGFADYNLIQQYYEQRNEIGHGNNFTIVISIPIVINDMKRLYNDLNS